MKILLDECVDRGLARELPGHSVETVSSMQWTGIQNGELLKRAAAAGFDVFVTVDRNLSFQQNIGAVPLIIVILSAESNRLADLAPLAPAILKALPELRPGQVRLIVDSI